MFSTYCKARVGRRGVSQAVGDRHREVLGFAVGDCDDGACQTAFLRSIKPAASAEVQLVVSDAQAGLEAAIAAVLLGTSWQRRRVRFMRNVLARVPKGNAEMVAAAFRTVSLSPTPSTCR